MIRAVWPPDWSSRQAVRRTGLLDPLFSCREQFILPRGVTVETFEGRPYDDLNAIGQRAVVVKAPAAGVHGISVDSP